MKVCCRCKEEKSLSEYYKDSSRIDGLEPRCKVCSASKNKAYHSNNKAEICAKKRVYEKEKYYADLEATREYKRTTKKIRYYKNIEKSRAKSKTDGRQWRANNREAYLKKYKEYKQRRRALKANNYDELIAEEITALLNSYKNKCCYCDCCLDDGYTLDHIIPVSKGGENAVWNLVPACSSCNSSKGNRNCWEPAG